MGSGGSVELLGSGRSVSIEREDEGGRSRSVGTSSGYMGHGYSRHSLLSALETFSQISPLLTSHSLTMAYS